MDEMKGLYQAAFEYLDAIDPRQWCKAFFEELPKCDLLLNNICEVFNKYILDARELPVVSLKKITDQIMLRFFSKRKEVDEMCGTICPKIRKKLDKNIDFASNYEAMPAAEHLFYMVNMRYTLTKWSAHVGPGSYLEVHVDMLVQLSGMKGSSQSLLSTSATA